MKEWFPSVGSSKKSQKQREDMKENDVVLTVDPDTPRGKWSLGRVLEIFRGTDVQIRVGKI